MQRQFETFEKFVEFLRAKKIGEATLIARVATTTSPGGEEISFRGRIAAEARYGKISRAEYIEQVKPHATTTSAPDLLAAEETASALRAAQLALATQLRLYRCEYQGIVAASKEDLTRRLQAAGITIVKPEM